MDLDTAVEYLLLSTMRSEPGCALWSSRQAYIQLTVFAVTPPSWWVAEMQSAASLVSSPAWVAARFRRLHRDGHVIGNHDAVLGHRGTIWAYNWGDDETVVALLREHAEWPVES